MAFTRDWNEASPDGGDNASSGDDEIRNFKVEVSDRLKAAIYGFIAGENDGVPGGKNLPFKQQSSDPTVGTDTITLYAKNVGANNEFFIKDEAGSVVQLTTAGKIGAGGVTLLANMDLIGSSTSDIALNTNKFTVAGATGNALIAGTCAITGVLTTTAASVLGDGSTLAAATETTDGARTIVDLNYAKTGDTVMHDSEGGYNNCDVNGTMAKVYTKYFTGTLDADSETSVAHGVTGVDKILSVTAYAYASGTSRYSVQEQHVDVSATHTLFVQYDGTNVILTSVGSDFQSQKYRIKVDYIL